MHGTRILVVALVGAAAWPVLAQDVGPPAFEPRDITAIMRYLRSIQEP
jgi:hypothetical protein